MPEKQKHTDPTDMHNSEASPADRRQTVARAAESAEAHPERPSHAPDLVPEKQLRHRPTMTSDTENLLLSESMPENCHESQNPNELEERGRKVNLYQVEWAMKGEKRSRDKIAKKGRSKEMEFSNPDQPVLSGYTSLYKDVRLIETELAKLPAKK